MTINTINIVGARPNFMKIAPIHRLMKEDNRFHPLLVHTGQHYDEKMSQMFFDELHMPQPDYYLGVGSGSHASQTASVMIKLEELLQQLMPDRVVVVGDVNSTLAASLVSAKLNIPVAHVEAGLRSFDRTMPEEINRIVTDSLSDKLYVTEQSGIDNLRQEGVGEEKMSLVGNVMIDSLILHIEKARNTDILQKLELRKSAYALLTLHRPSNVDKPDVFQQITDALEEIGQALPVVFPVHPRTRLMLDDFDLGERLDKNDRLILTEPLGYLDFLNLMINAKLVLTDSGGIQEETTFLKIPCLTLRENTERPITTEIGSNRLVGMKTADILSASHEALSNDGHHYRVPPLWDGKTAQRIIDNLSVHN